MIVPDWILYAWFALAAGSTAYVAWDNFVRKNPEETVMKWGWVLITLYMGPVALALYVLADKEPSPGTHEEFVRPLWKQGVGSTTAPPGTVWLVAPNMKPGRMSGRGHATAGSPKAEGAMAGHSMAGHAMGSPMRWPATRPQIAAVALVTVVAALLGVILRGQTVNLRLSADDTQGAIMPPGMIMTRDTPASAMRDMSAVDPDQNPY